MTDSPHASPAATNQRARLLSKYLRRHASANVAKKRLYQDGIDAE